MVGLFKRGFLLGGHAAGLVFRQIAGFGSLIQRLPLLRLGLHVEVVFHRVAQPGADLVDIINVFAVHLERDLVGAEGQTAVEITALLIGFHLV